MDRIDGPRVLLAEDDPVSARFLAEALRLLGCGVVHAGDGPTALAHARRERFDLLVLDLGLPGLDGVGVLTALRTDPSAASRGVRMLATTADRHAARGASLRAAGFDDVLLKPLDLDALAAALRAAPPTADAGVADAPALDDAAALRALGSSEAVADLRCLLASELGAQFAAIGAALRAGQVAPALDILHRLKASTRFCGALALAAAVDALLARLRAEADPAPALRGLEQAIAAYRAAVNR
jgi:CheY-like chemotaxis protein